MTRGKFVLVKNDKVYVSCEFNGDMYYDGCGHGPEVVERLKRVTDYDSFVKEVTEFDKENFGSSKEDDGYFGIYDYTFEECGNKIDCKQSTYFDNWFSDYLYVKNENGNTITIFDYNGKEHYLNPGEIVVLDFGIPIILVGSDGTVLPYEEKSEEDEETEDGSDDNPFEDVTINSFTVDKDEILKLYKANLIRAIPPTEEELYDALHEMISNL